MEKIIIKPISKELVIRSKAEDSHIDVFSYNYESSPAAGSLVSQESQGKLGSLFIVGQVQPATEDTSYMINLVASLAKREYYAASDIVPKEAFSKALKKINEVLQDFFRTKDIKINMGILAIVGENIFISRLGKFKVLLARDNQEIDILNNINLFSKEHIQEKEFSNIISGKVMPEDKILAFYPGKQITSRWKNIKNYLLRSAADQLAEKLYSIKQENENFSCAAIHIAVNKYTEPTTIRSPQPQELKRAMPKSPDLLIEPQPILANTAKPSQELNPKELLSVRPSESKIGSGESSNIYHPDMNKKSLQQDPSPKPEKTPAAGLTPLIIPSEFSSAKKDNFFISILKKLKPISLRGIGPKYGSLKRKKIIIIGSTAGIAITLVILTKFITIPGISIPGISKDWDKPINDKLREARTNLELAKDKVSKNSFLEARRLLAIALNNLALEDSNSKKLEKLKQDAMAVLDHMDNAIDTSPVLVYQIANDFGQPSLLSLAKDKLLIYNESQDQASGTLVKIKEGSLESAVSVENFSPTFLLGGEDPVLMANHLINKIGLLTVKNEKLTIADLGLTSPILSFYPYADNLYVLTNDMIFKIIDAAKGRSQTAVWLNKNVKLPPDPVAIAVDSKIFVFNKSGLLATYYKGDKISESNILLPLEHNWIFLTTEESAYLYLVEKQLGRIYILIKESGSLHKTLKINNNEPILSAAISENQTIYLLTRDNKVWKINP